MNKLTHPTPEILNGIRLLLLDVDGVLTDGRLLFDHLGNEWKAFHVHDGAGMAYWHRSGGISGLLSGRNAPVVAHRAKELGVHEVVLGRLDKGKAFEEILARRGLDSQQVAYVGDDVLDLPVLRRAGFSAAPADAHEEVRKVVHHITAARGGKGAVREVVELLLKARGGWQHILDLGMP